MEKTPVEQLTNWVANKYAGQLIRHTTEPYFNHLIAVADMVKGIESLGYEIGLCHDLLEDTETTTNELWTKLTAFGYLDEQADLICSCVVELTDVFTAIDYPDLKKSERKNLEAARLLNISATAQTLKYADLIYNIGWTLNYDLKHADRYLLKKQQLIMELNRGDQGLRQKALDLIQTGLGSLTQGKRPVTR